MKLKTVKDRLKDETLDLSLCDLSDVPVREIALIRKATHLDLSNNLLVSLPSTFVTLKQIVKLDLSKNMLTEIPENFGEMKQLKHLDLYANQISRLPLSLSELKNLRWLDLKENPLTPAVASVAGPCSNSSECQACARNIVAYLLNVKVTIAEEKLRRLNAAIDTESAALKKGEKKKKKKSIEKESKKILDKNGSKVASEELLASENKDTDSSPQYYGNTNKENGFSKGKVRRSFFRTFFIVALWILLPCLAMAFTVLIFPFYSKEKSEIFAEYVETYTGVSLGAFQKQSNETLQLSLEIVTAWINSIYYSLSDIYGRHFNTNANVPGNEK